jgi:hypothetical protein
MHGNTETDITLDQTCSPHAKFAGALNKVVMDVGYKPSCFHSSTAPDLSCLRVINMFWSVEVECGSRSRAMNKPVSFVYFGICSSHELDGKGGIGGRSR